MGSDIGEELTTNVTDDFGFKSVGSIRLVGDYEEKLPYTIIDNLAIAPHKKIFAAAGCKDLVLGDIDSLRKQVDEGNSDFDGTKLNISGINTVLFTKDERYLIISKDKSVKFQIIESKESFMAINSEESFQEITITNPINKVLSSYIKPEILAVLDTSLNMYLVDITTKAVSSLTSDVIDFDWSPNGKLILAKNDGSIKIIQLDGSEISIIPRPEDLEKDEVLPVSISWLLNDKLFVTFGEDLEYNEDEEPFYDVKSFLISKNDSNDEYIFHETYDAVVASGSVWRKRSLYAKSLKNLSNSITDLNIITSSISPEISPITLSEFLSPGNDSERASLPMNEETNNDLTSIGLAVDLGYDNGSILEVSTSIPEADWLPIVWVLGSDGRLQGWYVFHAHDVKNGSFKKDGPLKYEDELYNIAINASSSSSETTSEQPKAKVPVKEENPFNSQSTFGTKGSTSIFGSSSTSDKPLFGSSTNTTGFGTSGFSFGTTSDKPLFGSSATTTTTTPAFGLAKTETSETSESKSLFGSSTTAATPAFGASTFGSNQTSATTDKPLFGSSTPAFGSSTFGSTKPETSETKPLFGSSSTTTTPAFGTSTFGSSTFGASETKPAFGSSTFGQSSFGSNQTSSTTTTAFGTTGFGQSSFGSTSTSGFGQSSFGTKPTTDTTTTVTSGDNKLGTSTSGFASFAKDKPVFGSTAFGGSKSNSESPFATAANNSKGSLFGGSTSVEGKTDSPFAAFGKGDGGKSTSPFASFGKTESEKKSESPFATFGKTESNEKSESPFALFGKDVQTTAGSPFSSLGEKKESPFIPVQSSSMFGKTENKFSSTPFSFNKPHDEEEEEDEDEDKEDIDSSEDDDDEQLARDLNSYADFGSEDGLEDDEEEQEEEEEEDDDDEDEEGDESEILEDELKDGLEDKNSEEEFGEEEEAQEQADIDASLADEGIDESINEEQVNADVNDAIKQEDEEEEKAEIKKQEEDDVSVKKEDTAEPKIKLEDNEESIEGDSNALIKLRRDLSVGLDSEPEEVDGDKVIKVKNLEEWTEKQEAKKKNDITDETDEKLYSEAKGLDAQGNIKTEPSDASAQSEPTGVDQSHKVKPDTFDAGIVSEPDLIDQSHIFKPDYVDVCVQSFDNDQVYQGEFSLPKSIKKYVSLTEVVYPKLSSDKIVNTIEKLIYDTEAEFSIFEQNSANIRDFINDHLNYDVVHGVESLNHGYQWRLAEAKNLIDIIIDKEPEIKKLSDEISDKFQNLNEIKKDMRIFEKQFLPIKEEILSLELKNDKKLTKLKDLSFDSKVLQERIRKQNIENNDQLRIAQEKIILLKTIIDTLNENNRTDGSINSTALQGLVSHLNTISTNYSNGTKEITDRIAKLNKNHEKILESLKLNNNLIISKDNDMSEKLLTQLEIDSSTKKLEKMKLISEQFRSKPIEQLTSEF